MSDVPFDGWWLADNGRWYPPETHPAFNPAGPMEPPTGWFQDANGDWRPPHVRAAVVDLSESAAGAGPTGEATVDATEPTPGAGRRRRRVLVGVWTVVVLGAGAIGVALIADDGEVPTKVGSETTTRPLLPPSTMTSDETTSTTSSTTTTVPAATPPAGP